MVNQIDSSIFITGQKKSGKTFLAHMMATYFINNLHISSSKINIIIQDPNTNPFWSLALPNANIFDCTQNIANIQSSIMESYENIKKH